MLLILTPVFAQLTVGSDGSVSVNSYANNYGRANRTIVHNQFSCAYNLWNTYYDRDVFYIRGDGTVAYYGSLYNYSDSTLKTNIQDIDSALGKISKLHGVKYNRKYYVDKTVSQDIDKNSSSGHSNNVKEEKLEPLEYGLIAQEVESVIPEAVQIMHDSLKAISYTSIIPILIEAIKEQQTQIESLQSIVTAQEAELLNLKNCCEDKNEKLKSAFLSTSILDKSTNIDSVMLFQNIPNPFRNKTEIKFIIPSDFVSAKIFILNLQGVQIKSYEINKSGRGSIFIEGNELEAGMYIYCLVLNNSIIDTKKMLLTLD